MRVAATRLPPLLCTLDLPTEELRAAALDGELYALAGGFSLIDLPETPELRARSVLIALAEPRLILERMTAAWVYEATPTPPAVVQLCVDVRARARPTELTGATIREVVLDAEDRTLLGGVTLTSPARTIVDLVRIEVAAPASDAADLPAVLRALSAIDDVTVDDCIAVMERRRNLPGKRDALRIIREALEDSLERA